MAMRTCHNCIYARFDACEWLHNAFFDLPLAPKCANHAYFPGVLMEVTGVPCPNYRPRPPEPESNVKRITLDDGHYAIVDAAAKKEGKKLRRKEGKRGAHSRRKEGDKSRRPKGKQSTRRRKRAKGSRAATQARQARRRPNE